MNDDKNIIKNVMFSCARNILFTCIFLGLAYLLVSLTTEQRSLINKELNLLYSNIVVYFEPIKSLIFSSYSENLFIGLFICWLLMYIWIICLSAILENKNIQAPKYLLKFYMSLLLSGAYIIFVNCFFIDDIFIKILGYIFSFTLAIFFVAILVDQKKS